MTRHSKFPNTNFNITENDVKNWTDVRLSVNPKQWLGRLWGSDSPEYVSAAHLATLDFLNKETLLVINHDISTMSHVALEADDKAAKHFETLQSIDCFFEKASAEVSVRAALSASLVNPQIKAHSHPIAQVLDPLKLFEGLISGKSVKTVLIERFKTLVFINDDIPKEVMSVINKIEDFDTKGFSLGGVAKKIENFVLYQSADFQFAYNVYHKYKEKLISPFFAEKVGEYIATFQSASDQAIDTLIDQVIHELALVSQKGVMPEDAAERSKIEGHVALIYRYHAYLEEKMLNSGRNAAVVSRYQKFKAACQSLYVCQIAQLFTSENRSIQADVSENRLRAQHCLGAFGLTLSDKALKDSDGAQSFSRLANFLQEIEKNPVISLGLHTSAILGANKKFDSVEKEAEFLADLYEQRINAFKALEASAKKFKISIVSSEAQNDPVLATIDARKLKCLPRLYGSIAAKLFVMTPTQSFGDADLKQLNEFLRDKVKALESPEKIRSYLQASIKILEDFGSVGTVPGVKLNKAIGQCIKDLKSTHGTYVGEKLDEDEIKQITLQYLDDAILQQFYEGIAVRADTPAKHETVTTCIDEMISRLLSYRVIDESDREDFIDNIRQYVQLLTSGRQKKKYHESLQKIERIYEGLPKGNLLGVVSARKNDYADIKSYINQVDVALELVQNADKVAQNLVLSQGDKFLHAQRKVYSRIVRLSAMQNRGGTLDLESDHVPTTQKIDLSDDDEEKNKSIFSEAMNVKSLTVSESVEEKSQHLEKVEASVKKFGKYFSDDEILPQLITDNGFTYDLSTKAHIDKFYKDAERAKELEKRYQIVKDWLESKKYLDSENGLNPRSTYLMQYTPRALSLLCDRLKRLENKIDESADLILSQAHEDVLYSVKLTREEIAITMMQRLCLTKNNQPADLVASHYNLRVKASDAVRPCEIFSLSDQEIRDYYHFVEQYGDAETRQTLLQEVGALEAIEINRHQPFDQALDEYLIALKTTSDDKLLSQKATKVALNSKSWMPQRKATDTDQSYYKKVKTALLPSQLAKPDGSLFRWVKSQEKYLASQKKTISRLTEEKNKKLKIWEVNKRSVDAYKKDRSGFLGTIAGFFEFITGDTLDKRKRRFDESDIKLVKAEAELKSAEVTYKADTKFYRSHVTRVASHMVDQIRDEIAEDADDLLSQRDIEHVKSFVASQYPDLSVALERKLDYASEFLKEMREAEDVEELSQIARCFKRLSNDKLKTASDRLVALLRGDVPYKTDLISALRNDLVSLIMASGEYKEIEGEAEKNEYVEIQVDLYIPKIQKNYLNALLNDAISGNGAIAPINFKQLLSFYSNEERIQYLESFAMHIEQSADSLVGFEVEKQQNWVVGRQNYRDYQDGSLAREEAEAKFESLKNTFLENCPMHSDLRMDLMDYVEVVASQKNMQVFSQENIDAARVLLKANSLQITAYEQFEQYDDAYNLCLSSIDSLSDGLMNQLKFLEVLKDFDGYIAKREQCFKPLQHYLEQMFNDGVVYSKKQLSRDEQFFQLAEATKLESELAEPSILQKALSASLLSASNNSTLKWNENLAVLVERYASHEAIGVYRVLRLKEMMADAIADPAMMSDQSKSQFDTFLKTQVNNDGIVSQAEVDFVSELVQSSNSPSLMCYLIVDRIGSDKDRQDILAKWIKSTLVIDGKRDHMVDEILLKVFQRFESNHDIDPLSQDFMLHKKNELIKFVGEHNYNDILNRLRSLVAVDDEQDSGNEETISVVFQNGHSKASQAEQLNADKLEQIRLLGSEWVETLLYNMTGVNVSKLNEYVKQLKNTHDLQVFVKSYQSNPDALNTQMAFVTDYLLLSSDEREKQRIVTQSSDDEEALIEEDVFSGAKKYDYDYQARPGLFYRIYLSEVQTLVEQSFISEIPRLLERLSFFQPNSENENDFLAEHSNYLAKVKSWLNKYDEKRLLPLSVPNTEKHLEPLLDQLDGDVVFNDMIQDKEMLLENLRLIGSVETAADYLGACKAWVGENSKNSSIKSIAAYVDCSEKYYHLRMRFEAIEGCINAEDGINAYLKSAGEDDASLLNAAKVVKQQQNYLQSTEEGRLFAARLNSWLPALIKYINELILLDKVSDQELQSVVDIVNVIGDGASKAIVDRVNTTHDMLKRLSFGGDNNANASNDELEPAQLCQVVFENKVKDTHYDSSLLATSLKNRLQLMNSKSLDAVDIENICYVALEVGDIGLTRATRSIASEFMRHLLSNYLNIKEGSSALTANPRNTQLLTLKILMEDDAVKKLIPVPVKALSSVLLSSEKGQVAYILDNIFDGYSPNEKHYIKVKELIDEVQSLPEESRATDIAKKIREFTNNTKYSWGAIRHRCKDVLESVAHALEKPSTTAMSLFDIDFVNSVRARIDLKKLSTFLPVLPKREVLDALIGLFEDVHFKPVDDLIQSVDKLKGDSFTINQLESIVEGTIRAEQAKVSDPSLYAGGAALLTRAGGLGAGGLLLKDKPEINMLKQFSELLQKGFIPDDDAIIKMRQNVRLPKTSPTAQSSKVVAKPIKKADLVSLIKITFEGSDPLFDRRIKGLVERLSALPGDNVSSEDVTGVFNHYIPANVAKPGLFSASVHPGESGLLNPFTRILKEFSVDIRRGDLPSLERVKAMRLENGLERQAGGPHGPKK